MSEFGDEINEMKSKHDQSDNDSETSIAVEFYDAISDEGLSTCQSNNILASFEPNINQNDALETESFLKHDPLLEKVSIDLAAESVISADNFDLKSNQIEPTQQEISIPRPPPRNRRKKNSFNSASQNKFILNENTGNNSSGDSQSVTNSIESTTQSFGKASFNQNNNLSSILDDIVSIKGDLSITEVDDKKSVYNDENLANRSSNYKPFVEQNRLFSNNQLEDISKNFIRTKKSFADNQTNLKTSESTSEKNVKPALNLNNNENASTLKVENSNEEENFIPKFFNPLNLHLMKLTSDYDNNEILNISQEKESLGSSLTESTFKSVTSLISSTLNEIKSDIKDKSIERKMRKKMKSDDNIENFENSDDVDEDEKLNTDKNGKLKSKILDLKKLGTGLIKGVKNVKTPSSKDRSTFHVDLKANLNDPGDILTPAPPRYKIKINHKRGSPDFDGLKLVQEINDCKGAIWCMRFSNCSQLLATAGQDHMLRVYCAQKSWKYFTQLRNKASGQHISPSSTKERGSNGDSFGRIQSQKSYSRSGSLNASDSHNNSSSSSISSGFAKDFLRDEDNTLSEEGPFLLFTIYRGHTADVLDLAWSKNHFLLSSSMDKTVRLWHVTRIECLCTFRHIDFVTTIQFHPRDDRYFLSGSLDGKLRLWNIPDKRVTLWNEVTSLSSQRGNNNINNVNESDMSPSHGLITASSFVQNGKFAVIGTYDGRIIFYTTDQLKYFTQIHVSGKSVSSQNSSSRKFRTNKVTGIESIDENNKILVTTNDSRLRLYDLRDLSLTCKYKGCINQSSQIKASVSHDHKYIICGSENNSFYIWRVQDNLTIGQRRDRNKQYECIRLLNPPPSQTQNTAPVSFANESKDSNTTEFKEKNLLSKHLSEENQVINMENPSSIKTETDPVDVLPPQASLSQASYSNAATKIVTSAVFAPVPGQLEEKARYVIAAADFNGYIRIFSKY